MDKDLLKDIEEFCNQRQDKLYENLISKSKEHKTATKTLKFKYTELKQLLPEEAKVKLIDLDNAKTTVDVIDRSLFYRQGFIDAIQMYKLLNQ